jgi:F-type H+-transporting ATPase subunit alpha
LLERATHLSPEQGGGSLTALPIVETQAQNIAAYIPTNLISITDGQIYLSPTLFGLGILPAVDVGRSVSRVGGKAQLPVHRAAAGSLKLAYAQFEELETFTRLGARLDQRTRGIIEHGRRIRECLKQPEHEHVPVAEQIVLLPWRGTLRRGSARPRAGRGESRSQRRSDACRAAATAAHQRSNALRLRSRHFAARGR